MKNCEICNAPMNEHSIKGLMICPRCGFIAAGDMVSNDELKKIYSKNYFLGEEYTDYLADKKIHYVNFISKVKRLVKKTGPIKEKVFFEIGCAYGLFLKTIKSKCKKCSGIDISEDAINYAKKKYHLNVTSGDFLDYPLPDEKADVVCMWDTIEHLAKPAEYIKKINKITKIGGYICITTGDIGSLNAKLRGKNWRQIHPPTHLYYFSKKTLSQLLENNGYEVVDISYPGNRLSIRNIAYSILCLKKKYNRLYDFIKDWKLLDLSIYVNLHDYIYIIGKKKEELDSSKLYK